MDDETKKTLAKWATTLVRLRSKRQLTPDIVETLLRADLSAWRDLLIREQILSEQDGDPGVCIRAMRRSVAGVFPLGIAARMTIALGSVAILAIAANIVGETTVLFIRTHTTEAPEAPRSINRIAPRPARPETPAPVVDARRSALAPAIDVHAIGQGLMRNTQRRQARTHGGNSVAFLDP